MVFFCDLSQLPDQTINTKFILIPVVDKMEADYDVSGFCSITFDSFNEIYSFFLSI